MLINQLRLIYFSQKNNCQFLLLKEFSYLDSTGPLTVRVKSAIAQTTIKSISYDIQFSFKSWQFSKYLFPKIKILITQKKLLKSLIKSSLIIMLSMIEESEADKFVTKLQDLVNNQYKTTKGQDVILILGETGNGKSTVINMIAGSKFTASKKGGKWILEADPQVAKIGHSISQTFEPNYWNFSGTRVYDCAGFHDQRGIEYEIVKSFFIKEIAVNAKSIKVILVSELANIQANRCGSFAGTLQQLSMFVTDFNPTTDFSLIVTKATPDYQLEDIAAIIQTGLEVHINPQKITMIYKPTKAGPYEPNLDFGNIFASVPAISAKCKLPLSTDAQLKLQYLNKEISKSVEQTIIIYSHIARMFYLQVLAAELEASHSQVNRIYDLFQLTERKIKESSNPEDFVKNIQRYSNQLQQQCKLSFKYEQIYQFIRKKVDQLSFITDKIDDFVIDISHWITNVKFGCESYIKSNNAAAFKNLDVFSSFLKGLKIDINSNIRNQAHSYLLKPKQIQAQYTGTKQINGILAESGKYTHKFKKPYVVDQSFSATLKYSGSASYSGNKYYSGQIQAKRCSCGYDLGWFGKGQCKLCKHDDIKIPYSGYAYYQGAVPYSGSVDYEGNQKQVFDAVFSRSMPYSVKKPYNQNVHYSGKHTACCDGHHQCSCSKLAQIAISGKELYEDILYYNNIINSQKKEISRLQNAVHDQAKKDSAISLINQFNIKGYQATNRQIVQKDVATIIHRQLTSSHMINAPYDGETTVTVSRSYSEQICFQGSQVFSNEIEHSAKAPYLGSVSYQKSQYYSGSVKRSSCYDNCTFCTITYHNQSYSGYAKISGVIQYSGTIPFRDQKDCQSLVEYDQIVPRAGTLEKNVVVNYDGTNDVPCQMSKQIGDGHHSCTSCDVWERYVTALKKLLEIKPAKLNEIKDNKRKIEQLAQTPTYPNPQQITA